MSVTKVLSGAQSGADRAALDWAIFRVIPHGGWCPKGRKAEDGKIPPQYQLTETPSASYLQRTEWNVRDSDGTVIFTVAAALADGSKRTVDFARRHGKRWLHLSERGSYESPGERLAAFIRENGIKVLNVAGSRGSKQPGVAAFAKRALEDAFYPRVEAMVVQDSVQTTKYKRVLSSPAKRFCNRPKQQNGNREKRPSRPHPNDNSSKY